MKYLLLMFLCSTIDGNSCKQLKPKITQFKDHRECAIYGYNYSYETILNLNKEFVNEYKIFTQFMCREQTEQI